MFYYAALDNAPLFPLLYGVYFIKLMPKGVRDSPCWGHKCLPLDMYLSSDVTHEACLLVAEAVLFPSACCLSADCSRCSIGQTLIVPAYIDVGIAAEDCEELKCSGTANSYHMLILTSPWLLHDVIYAPLETLA